MLSKYCKKCNRDLPVTSFSNCSGGNYLRPECKDCGRRLAKERKILKEKYGDPPIDYVCPICNKNEANIASGGGKKYTKWVRDHDHSKNKFRGWLCHTCNMGVGSFEDNIERLERAIKYLKNGI